MDILADAMKDGLFVLILGACVILIPFAISFIGEKIVAKLYKRNRKTPASSVKVSNHSTAFDKHVDEALNLIRK